MVGEIRGRVAAIGPLLSYTFREGTQEVTLSGRWFHEFDVTHRVQGNSILASLSFPLYNGAPQGCGAVAKSGSAQPRAPLAGRCPGGLANTAFVAQDVRIELVPRSRIMKRTRCAVFTCHWPESWQPDSRGSSQGSLGMTAYGARPRCGSAQILQELDEEPKYR
jgi:hypothetical protein